MKTNYCIFDNFCERQLILSKENFLNESEISTIFEIASEINFEKGLVNSNLDSDPYFRSSYIKWILKNEKSLWLYKKLIESCLYLNYTNYFFILENIEPLQFSSYDFKNKDLYSCHNDCGGILDNKNFYRDVRKLSFSIQLSEESDYTGGDLKIYTEDASLNKLKNYTLAPKKKGSITFFPSRLMHEVTEVTGGNRISLVGWFSGKNIL